MRKNISKRSHYDYIASNPHFRRSQYQNYDRSVVVDHSRLINQSKSTRKSQSVMRQSRNRSESNRDINYISFGQPTHTIIHIPPRLRHLKKEIGQSFTQTGKKAQKIERNENDESVIEEDRARSQLKSRGRRNLFGNLKKSRSYFTLGQQEPRIKDDIRKDVVEKIRSHRSLIRLKKAQIRDMIDNSKSTKALSDLYEEVEEIKLENKMLNPIRDLSSARKKVDVVAFNIPRSREFFKAVKRGHYSKVEHMIMEGDDVLCAVDKLGQTALHWAVLRNVVDIAELLVKCGANVNATDSANRTALHIAARKNFWELAEYLINNEADYTILSVAGQSPIDMAPNESLVRSILARKIMELFPLAIKKQVQEKRARELAAN